MAQTEAQLADYDWELVQAKGSRSVYRLSLAGAVKAYAKVYHPQDIFQKLTNRLKPRTAREARILKQLAACGLPVPRVLGPTSAVKDSLAHRLRRRCSPTRSMRTSSTSKNASQPRPSTKKRRDASRSRTARVMRLIRCSMP